MGRYIDSKDGGRILVSDDTPDEVEECEAAVNVPLANIIPVVNTVISCGGKQLLMQLRFIRHNSDKVRLKGSVATDEFLWLIKEASSCKKQLLVTSSLFASAYAVVRITGKAINQLVTNIDLLLMRHI